MSEFYWRAATASGEIVEGSTQAGASAQVIRQLRDKGLTPLRVDDAAAPGAGIRPPKKETAPGKAVAGANAVPGAARSTSSRRNRGPVNQKDVLAFTTELAIMLRAGLPLDNALRVLIEMSYKPSVTELLQQVLDALKGGTPFSRALAQRRELLGDFYINMVHSGEVSGQLSHVLDRLVAHMERLRDLRENIVSAIMYPCILLVVAVLSVVGMLGFVVPQFEPMFADLGDALPLPTQIVVALGHGFREYGWFIAIASVLLFFAARRWLRTPAGSAWLQVRLLHIPVFGPLVHKFQLTLFSRSLGTLLGNGVPMLTALHIATETVSNVILRTPLEKLTPTVKQGGRLVDAMSASGIFEPLAINLVRVGEETGRIGTMMLELSNVLNRDVELGIKRALTLVEPVLILVLGMLIGCIIVSILMGVLAINDLAG